MPLNTPQCTGPCPPHSYPARDVKSANAEKPCLQGREWCASWVRSAQSNRLKQHPSPSKPPELGLGVLTASGRRRCQRWCRDGKAQGMGRTQSLPTTGPSGREEKSSGARKGGKCIPGRGNSMAQCRQPREHIVCRNNEPFVCSRVMQQGWELGDSYVPGGSLGVTVQSGELGAGAAA